MQIGPQVLKQRRKRRRKSKPHWNPRCPNLRRRAQIGRVSRAASRRQLAPRRGPPSHTLITTSSTRTMRSCAAGSRRKIASTGSRFVRNAARNERRGKNSLTRLMINWRDASSHRNRLATGWFLFGIMIHHSCYISHVFILIYILQKVFRWNSLLYSILFCELWNLVWLDFSFLPLLYYWICRCQVW